MKRTVAVIIIVLLLISPSWSHKNDSLYFSEGDTSCIIPPPSDISDSIERLNRIKKAVHSEHNNSYDFIMDYIVSSPSQKEGELLYYTKEQADEFIKEIESAVIVGDYRNDGNIPDIHYYDDSNSVSQKIFIGSEECYSHIFVTSYTQKSEYFNGNNLKDKHTVSYSYDINVNGQNMTVSKIEKSSLNYIIPVNYEVYYKTVDRYMVFSFITTENFRFKEVKDALEKLKFVKVGDLMKEAEQST